MAIETTHSLLFAARLDIKDAKSIFRSTEIGPHRIRSDDIEGIELIFVNEVLFTKWTDAPFPHSEEHRQLLFSKDVDAYLPAIVATRSGKTSARVLRDCLHSLLSWQCTVSRVGGDSCIDITSRQVADNRALIPRFVGLSHGVFTFMHSCMSIPLSTLPTSSYLYEKQHQQPQSSSFSIVERS